MTGVIMAMTSPTLCGTISRRPGGTIEPPEEYAEKVAEIVLGEARQLITREFEAISSEIERSKNRVTSLTGARIANRKIVEAVGIPDYISDVSAYSAYGIETPGWYIFARITIPAGVEMSNQTTVEGAAGYIIADGYVDIAVRFEVAAVSVPVVITWDADCVETFVFKATDLAVRNLDYRVTFYVYDIDEFTTWEYKFAGTDNYAGTTYYTLNNGVYTPASVTAGEAVAENTYYVHRYELTEDQAFIDGKSYYTLNNGVYTPASVTAGEAVAENTYYVDAYELTADKTFAGTHYYIKDDGEYVRTAVIAGDPIPTYYVETTVYTLATGTFEEGVTYYTLADEEYTEAEVTIGEDIPASTYYVQTPAFIQTTDETFNGETVYYTKNGNVYSDVYPTTGDPIPATYVHSKVIFAGMTPNITYRCGTLIDCPVEFVLPDIDDDTHGCWFEIRMRHAGSYSSTLVPLADDVKIATEHTQQETAGVNMVNLHYSDVNGVKIWRFMNTHSSIPA